MHKPKSFIRLPILIYILLLNLILVTPADAVVIFAAAPQSNTDQAKQTFEPLAKYLTEILDEPVVYQQPADWADYSQNMRDGKYDIVFDAPHFGSWRIKNIQHVPVVRLPGKLGFVILTNNENDQLKNLRDLVGVKICALASPSLGTMTVYNLFRNPVFMPQIQEIAGESKDVYKALKRGQCEAAVLREVVYKHLVPADKRDVKVIVKSESMPEHIMTIGPRLFDKKNLIVDKLISSQGSSAAANLLVRYGKRSKTFIRVKTTDYAGLENLLTDVVWGW